MITRASLTDETLCSRCSQFSEQYTAVAAFSFLLLAAGSLADACSFFPPFAHVFIVYAEQVQEREARLRGPSDVVMTPEERAKQKQAEMQADYRERLKVRNSCIRGNT